MLESFLSHELRKVGEGREGEETEGRKGGEEGEREGRKRSGGSF